MKAISLLRNATSFRMPESGGAFGLAQIWKLFRRAPLGASLIAEHMVAGGLFAVVFGVYCSTLCPGVYPGSSAVATGHVLGLLPAMPVSHPLWLTVSRIAAEMPISDLPHRLNGVTALFGSLAAVWLFRLSRNIMLGLILPAFELDMVPVCDDAEEAQLRRPEGDANGDGAARADDAHERLGATIGGAICALAFAFSAPLWSVSVSLHAQPFDLFLFLVAADLLLAYYTTGRLGYGVVFAFLCGVLAVEAPVFPLISLALLFFLVQACRRYEHIQETFFLLLILAGTVGAVANLLLCWAQWGNAEGAAPVGLVQAVKLFGLSYRASLLNRASIDHLFFTWALPVLGLLLVALSLRATVFFRDELGRWKWRIMNALCTVFAMAQMLNAPKSIWALAREGAVIPVLPALAVACMTGMLFLYWYRMASDDTFLYDDETSLSPFWKRFAGLAVDSLLVIMVLRAIGLNLPEADGRKAQFADAVAQEILDQSAGAQCLFTDGTLDLNVLIRSHITGRKLAVVPTAMGNGADDVGNPAARRAPGLLLVRPSGGDVRRPEEIVEQWMRSLPGGQCQISVIGSPSVWLRAGLSARPNGLTYSVALEPDAVELSALYEKNREVWRRVAPFLRDDDSLAPALRQTQAALRTHTSRVANDLGVMLDQASHGDEAREAYAQALSFDGNNLCAALNRFSRCLRTGDPTAERAFGELIGNPLLQAEGARTAAAFDALLERYGTLFCQPADSFLPRVLANMPPGLSERPGVVWLINQWLSPHPGATPTRLGEPVDERRQAAALRAHMEDGQRNPDLALVVQEHMEGRNCEAESRARRYVANHPNNLAALSLLAELLIRREALQEVSSSVLPAMRATAGGIDNAFVLVVQGGVCMHMASARLQEARVSFLRALSLNPHLEAAHDWLLDVDAKLGNDALSEADAMLVIKNDPAHPVANALLGRFNSAANRRAEAEAFFRKSLSRAPSAEVYAELSDLLRRQGRLEEAEQQARLAIRMEPCFGPAWCVLSRVLSDGGRGAEASDALRCASTLARSDGAGSRLSSVMQRSWEADTYVRVGAAIR